MYTFYEFLRLFDAPLTIQHGSRRHSSRGKQMQTALTPINLLSSALSQEECRLASSDLSDCEEVWTQELGLYTLDTQKRQHEVEIWFEDSLVVSFCMNIDAIENRNDLHLLRCGIMILREQLQPSMLIV